jgi:hypothetical protein
MSIQVATNMHTGTIYLLIIFSILDLILLNADTYYSINIIVSALKILIRG